MNTDCISADNTQNNSDQDEPGSSAKGDPPERTGRPDSGHCDIELDAGPVADADAAQLKADTAAAVAMLNRPVARVAVRVVDDRTMISLHQAWHGLDSTTDVLTFEHDRTGPLQVDIAVCADEATRRCAGQELDPCDELMLYIVHGLLHCCGHDDHDEAAFNAMHAEEDRILTALGRGPIYRQGNRRS